MQNAIMIVKRKALLNNFYTFKHLLQNKTLIYAVVKANGYGHGAEIVAGYLEKYVNGFAVSTVEEGISLRVSGIQKDILVFTPISCHQDAIKAFTYSLIISVGDKKSLNLSKRYSIRNHICINTGMNRYGFCKDELISLLKKGSFVGAKTEGIYSHLFASQNADICKKQRALFIEVTDYAETLLKRNLIRHLSATGGVIRGDLYHFDAIRLGIGLYGYLPYEVKSLNLEKAMRVYAPVTSHCSGVLNGCGYGLGTGKTTVRFGYADGLQRKSRLGKNGLCMDCFVSEKILKGYYPIMIDADKTAVHLGTISYEVLCSFGDRIERFYE